MESIEKLRELAADINATEITDHLDVVGKCRFHAEWLNSWHEAFDAACDGIEREIAETHVLLPLDADGVPIHVGDVVEFGETRNKGNVKALNEHMAIVMHVDSDYTNYAKYGLLWSADACTHVKPRTIEDVLQEFGDWYAHTKGGCDEDGIIAEYADELRELIENSY